jgi:hypothetical protein
MPIFIMGHAAGVPSLAALELGGRKLGNDSGKGESSTVDPTNSWVGEAGSVRFGKMKGPADVGMAIGSGWGMSV